jgi:hypothetical protein
MRHLPADDWCRTWTAPIVLLVVAIILALTLACSDSPEETARRELARSTSFWVLVKSSVSGRGPTTYTTREPLTLADGSQVACVATFDAIWCRDAK